ncbi:MAG: hypothetical protein IIA09_17705 [Proteobacteria bacterium]|nr:hypothetical protein [Pseudomonadota bacterium]
MLRSFAAVSAACVILLLGNAPAAGQCLQARLTANDAAQSDEFGQAVSISGTTIVVNAWHKRAAYVFEYDGANWVQRAKLTSPASCCDGFGRAVASSGDTAVVGAPSGAAGAVYVFRRNDNGTPSGTEDDVWNLEAKIIASDGRPGDNFGDAVAVAMEDVGVTRATAIAGSAAALAVTP